MFLRGLVLGHDGGRYMEGKVWLCGRESKRRIPEDRWGVLAERGSGQDRSGTGGLFAPPAL